SRVHRATRRPSAGSPALRLLTLAVAAPTAALGNVREQRKLAGALDRPGELALVAAARPGDPARADLAAVGDEPTQRREFLVIDLLDPVAAVRARLAAARGHRPFPVAPANWSSTLLCHLNSDPSH